MLWTILFRAKSGAAYDAGSKEFISISQVASLVAEIVGDGLALVFLNQLNEGFPTRYVPDCRRANLELNLCETTPLPEAIRKTADWLRLHV